MHYRLVFSRTGFLSGQATADLTEPGLTADISSSFWLWLMPSAESYPWAEEESIVGGNIFQCKYSSRFKKYIYKI